MWRVVAVVALGTLVLACGGSEPTATVGPSTLSHLGIPLPPGSEPDSDLADAWLVPGWSYERVVEWYREELPFGQPLNGEWAWCEWLIRDTFRQWTYHKPGTMSVLVLVLNNDSTPGILIRSDESGPC